ncbi:MAG: hypothetical protein MK100_01270 [Phycisphaerales bacterium]|nr:hypothetical protein [Phycisphaerales bacterium]
MLRLMGATAALPLVSEAARAQTPPLRFWSWSMPLGDAANRHDITPLVRIKTEKLTGPQSAAQIGSIIRSRLAVTAELAICLQNYGMAQGNPNGPAWQTQGTTPLMLAWKDGVPRDASSAWWLTPWFAHGIAESRAWMLSLLESWPASGEHALPPPSRFLFDTEGWPTVGASARGVVETFIAMQKDRRWSEEAIPGFETSIEDLWQQAGEPPATIGNWFDPRNHEWARWYEGICFTAADAAMQAAAYQPIRERFPSCRSTNYRTATSFDGRDGRWDVVPGNDWCTYRHKASADLLSPVYYWPHPRKTANDELLTEQTVEWALQRVNAMRSSWGGIQADRIVPWIQLPGENRNDWGRDRTQSPDLTRRLLSMLTGVGVREFIVWYGDAAGTSTDWNAMVAAIQQA